MAIIINSALIQKYLDRRCTLEERAAVELFLQQEGSEQLLASIMEGHMTTDMEEAAGKTGYVLDEETWKKRMHARLKALPQDGGKVRRMAIWQKVAIVVAVIAGVSGIKYGLRKNVHQAVESLAMLEKTNPKGQRAIITLTDGSVVHLGNQSTLQYPEDFAAGKREVILEGEAFFDVKEDPAKPFIVRTGKVMTEVLGTSFRIKAFKDIPVEVAVATGKVRVDKEDNGQVVSLGILTAGKQLAYDENEMKTVWTEVDVKDVEEWTKARLAFNNSTLSDITKELERWYNVDITINNKAKANKRLTVTLFASAPLERTLKLLAAGNNFQYTIKQQSITIY
ncbi:FecR family protein [Chitinophaga skermanii]|uniref:FecR family protein n=1 Tax=Chitinophaga skermanii TaxID=331697 RepID=A0A327QWN4_9BACT|nr:FecR domain-containing protein [Chitinophaga skermanii]RAJ08741.1 FecR family protein [Chitinophaga skermanii]